MPNTTDKAPRAPRKQTAPHYVSFRPASSPRPNSRQKGSASQRRITISGEHRLPACCRRQLADDALSLCKNAWDRTREEFFGRLPKDKLAACAPQSRPACCKSGFMIPSEVEESLTIFLEFSNRRAGTEEVAIAVNVVDASDRRPEFVFARPGRRENCLFARIGAVPFVGRDLSRGVRRVFEQVILAILLSFGDRFHLCVDGDHCLAETIDYLFGFVLRRIDHHCASDWK